MRRIPQLLVIIGLSAAWPALAEPPAPPPDPPAEAEQPPARPWCTERGPLNVVAAYDAGKHFRVVEKMAQQATREMVASLCDGDVVRLASFGITVAWIGDPVIIASEQDREAIAKAFDRRPRPSETSSINDTLVKVALAYWDEGGLRDGDMPALYVFTDTIASSAPKRGSVMDFSWDAIPSFLQGNFLAVIGLLDGDAPAGRPKLLVTNAPLGLSAADFPQGRDTTFADIQQVFVPVPEPPVRVQRIVEVRDAPGAAPWLLWFGTLPGVLSLAGGLLVLLALGFLLGRGRKRRAEVAKAAHPHPSREVTLVLWDTLHREVVREETRTLEGSLHIGPTSEADFVVPGPYALELVNGNGEGPSVRSANMLGIEMRRPEGRTLVLAEGEVAPIRTGDRVDIGGGHEIEVRIQ